MAMYKVTRKCGHEEVVKLHGKPESHAQQLEREKEKLCAECYKNKRAAEEAPIIQEFEERLGLPPLQGTPKQVEYGRKVRMDMARALALLWRKDYRKQEGGKLSDMTVDVVADILAEVDKTREEVSKWADLLPEELAKRQEELAQRFDVSTRRNLVMIISGAERLRKETRAAAYLWNKTDILAFCRGDW